MNPTSATPEPIAYNQFFDLCTKAYERFGLIFALPVTKSPYHYLRQAYQSYPGGRVLDFGCGTSKQLQTVLELPNALYHTCDTDSGGHFTYNAIDQIPPEETYQIIAANQVFEHLAFDEAITAAIELAKHLAPGGIFLISTPNPQHPTRQLSNPTHKTPWGYLNLYALLALGGLDPFFCARYNKTAGPRWYERPWVGMICRVYRMDWCDNVYAVGRKVA
jgi:hypothetical protein